MVRNALPKTRRQERSLRQAKPICSQPDLLSIYEQTALKWNHDEPKVVDDLISWAQLMSLIQARGHGKVILDCGCGTGNICRLASGLAEHVIGIDISKRMVAEAEKNTPTTSNIVYLRGDMALLTEFLSPASVDLCISIFGVCCLPNLHRLTQAFRQMKQILRPDGALILQIPHPLDGFFRQSSSWKQDINPPKSYFMSGSFVRRRLRTVDNDWLLVARYHFTISDYITALAASGFHIVELIEPHPSDELIRKCPTIARESSVPSSMIIVAEVSTERSKSFTNLKLNSPSI